MRPLIAGNWKMHGLAAQFPDIEAIAAFVQATLPKADVLICLPANAALERFHGEWKRSSHISASNFISLRSLRDSSQADIALILGSRDVGGVLIGRASLKSADFDAVLRTLPSRA